MIRLNLSTANPEKLSLGHHRKILAEMPRLPLDSIFCHGMNDFPNLVLDPGSPHLILLKLPHVNVSFVKLFSHLCLHIFLRRCQTEWLAERGYYIPYPKQQSEALVKVNNSHVK
jgi:hypothetical protein